MSRTKFIGLIAMMLVSLTGIILVQMFWIKNAIIFTNDNFDQAVNSSLRIAANTIESNREMSFFFDNPMLSAPAQGDISGYISIGSYSSNDRGNVSYSVTNKSVTGIVDSTGNIKFSEPVVSRTDTTFYPDSAGVPTPGIHGGGFYEAGTNDRITTNSPSVQINSQEFLNWIRNRQDQFKNLSDQMIADVYQWEKTMDLSNEEVKYALQRSFALYKIETPFEFAILKDGKVDEGVFKKSAKNDFLKSNYKVPLFQDNIIRKDVSLSIIFPDRTTYVFGSMAWLLGASLLFSLIILATFALSLFFIIRQKKIADMKSDFLNNMTHEFKTPIATISLAADTITNPKVINDENSVRHFISMIKKENSRMNKKVETILQIASLDKKEIAFNFENISLHSIIEKAVDTIEIQLHQRNGKVNLKLNATEPVIYGDSEHLFNLVNNLLDNALKYSPDSPDITVETRNNESGIIMSVEDKGIGMSKTVQSKIFERFYRQTSGNVHDVKGFGLGLNYVRAIIDAHKGTVTVTSEPGHGSRFDIFLPFNWEN